MPRAIVLLLDSFGVGASLDAFNTSDAGADTFGHIVQLCEQNKTPLQIPHLVSLGLAKAHLASTGKRLATFSYEERTHALHGYAVEKSYGKDTPSGHWELAGVPVLFNWGYFPPEYPSFPEKLIQEFISTAQIPGILGNCHASGTKIIAELGEQHIKTGKPIVYTSADSVFQIAAHEHYFGLDKLYECCKVARKLVDEYNIGRVIARPFIGESGHFTRTCHRKDLSTPPPKPTLLQQLCEQGGQVIAVGKTADIYAQKGISESHNGENNMALFDLTLQMMQKAKDTTLIFTNFVDFDSKYGHRRDPLGYANALQDFDARLPELHAVLQADDLVIITADHGCDPTWRGSDHTREHVPVLAFGPKFTSKFIGRRDTFADIGQSIATHLGIKPLEYGNSFF